MPYRSPYGDYRGWNRDRYRDHFYGYGFAGYPFWPAWGYPYLPDYFDYPDDSDSYDSQSVNNYPVPQPYPEDDSGYDGPYPYEPQGPEAYPSPAPAMPTTPPAPPAAQIVEPHPDAPLVVIFKDGRPSEKIHNYMLTSTTLSVLDGDRQEIPVDQIDVAATARVNRAVGIDFAVPESR